MVVHACPDDLQSLKAEIARIAGAEVRGESAQGKLVVVLETDSGSRVTDVVEKINGFRGVLGTALVYHQVEAADAVEGD